MTRELLILRHGQAEKSDPGGDAARPITDPGKRGAQRIGVWLLRHGLIPDHIVSSPAERAIETARKTVKAMGMGAEGIVQDDRLYATGTGELRRILAEVPRDARRVLLVGHNPGLKRLLGHLDAGGGADLPKAGLARLELPDDWSNLGAGCGRLKTLTRPKELPEKFPFPGPDSDELRDRPAYYYTQSAVIPYRIGAQGPEILVIQSSKKKHWVVPKGIMDPGGSPQASAAKEAHEEAGIEGNVSERSLGSYVYEKWGAECTCHVYAMEVTRVLPEEDWEESHRGRIWVTPEQAAAARLKQPELGPMVEALARSLGAA